MKSKRRFDRTADELENIFNFLKMNWQEFQVQGRDQHDMELSVEEIFMNMVHHNTAETASDIEVSVEKTGRKITLSLSDFENEPFDITKAGEVDFEDYIKNKRSGGLGIHLVRQLMDDVKFEHNDGLSTITISKHI
jgi:anti-sigma regulatory factor (Ser/Thr protein kinase)